MRDAKNKPAREPAYSIHDHAAKDLHFIRTTMERAGSFTAVSGYATIAMGLSAILTAAITAALEHEFMRLQIWLADALLAASMALHAMRRRSRAAGLPLLAGPGLRFLLSLCPPLFVGAVLTAVFYANELYWMIRPMWLLLYGTAIATGGAFSVATVPAMGLAFMAFGTLAFFLPYAWHTALMAAGFGGIHILFGILIARRHDG